MDDEKKVFSFRRFLFGSVGKKLGWAFGILVLLMFALVLITYNLNLSIARDTATLKNVEAPLGIMVQEVIGYDAMLTGDARDALLHVENGELAYMKVDISNYELTGTKLDNLLKFEAMDLLNKSARSQADKDEVYGYLSALNKINLELVNLEEGAFNAMERGDIQTARSLVVSDKYDGYKQELANYYQKWAVIEAKVSEQYRLEVLKDATYVKIYNLYLGILFLIIAIIILLVIRKSIVKSILSLTGSVRELEKGNFKERSNIKTGDEIEELAVAFNRTIEQLGNTDEERQKIDKAKTEFLSITSHELRSPMTPMRAQLQMLMEGYFGKISKEQKDSISIVLRNTERLDKIIQDFLEISRIEAARLKFNFVNVSLEKHIKELVDEMKAFMPEKKIQIELNIPKLPVFEVDPDRVMQVLRNLVNNAIKFTSDGGKIIVSAKVEGNDLRFSVKDNGAGIPDKDQSRIFEPFFQAGGMYDLKVGGTGLGLSICKGIIESQKGRIWFESKEGKGTTFYFTIPFIPTREMEPIKILFSPKENIEVKLKKIMINYLGPLGEKEFEDLKLKGLTEEVLNDYILEMHKLGVIKNSEEFKSQIRYLFGSKKKEVAGGRKVDFGELKRLGMIKKDDKEGDKK